MPAPSKTIGYIVERVHFQLTGSATVDDALRTEIKDAMADTLFSLLNKIDHPAFRAELTITTEEDEADYPLPDDFLRLIDPGLAHSSTPYEPVQFYEQQAFDGGYGKSMFNTTGRPCYYTTRGRRWGLAQTAWTGDQVIRLVPTPDDVYTITGWYFALPDDLAELDDAAEIDQRFPRNVVHALKHGALVNFSQYLTPEQIATHQAKYVEYSKDIARNASAVVGRKVKKRPYRGTTSYVIPPTDALTSAGGDVLE